MQLGDPEKSYGQGETPPQGIRQPQPGGGGCFTRLAPAALALVVIVVMIVLL